MTRSLGDSIARKYGIVSIPGIILIYRYLLNK